MDDAIETLQACLRLLDLVHRVGEMIREGNYWGALRVGLQQLPIYQRLTIATVFRRPSPFAASIDITNPFLRPPSFLSPLA